MAKQRIIEAVLKFKDEFSKGMSGAMATLNKNSKQYYKVGQDIWRMGNKMESAGKALTKAITVPVVGMATASSKMYMDFEQSMAKVQTIADASGISMDGMSDKIMALSNKTGIASSDIANNVYDAISAGQTSAKGALTAVETAVNLSKAGFTDTASAMDILTTITNSYGKSAGSMTDISDQLINIQNRGKVTVDQLAQTMGGVIPIAKSNSVSLKDLGASYITLTKNGVDSAKSTTWMKSMYNELGKSSTTVAKTLKAETGKSFGELIKSGKSVGDVLWILKSSADKNGIAFNDMWSNVNAKSGANALLNNLDDYNEGLKSMGKSAGVTKTALGALKETDSAKLNKAINQLKNDMIKLGSVVLPIVMPYIEKGLKLVQSLADKFNNLDDRQKKIIVKLALMAATIGPLLVGGGRLTKTFGNLVQKFSMLPGAISNTGSVLAGLSKTFLGFGGNLAGLPGVLGGIAGVAGPILLVVAAVAALAGAFVYLWKTNDGFRKKMMGIWEKIKLSFDNFFFAIHTKMPQIQEAFKNIMSVIGPAWDAFCKVLAPVFVGAFQQVQNIIDTVLNVAMGAIDVFTGIFTGDGSRIMQGLNTIFSSLAIYLVNTLQNIWTAINGALGVIGNGIISVAGQIFSRIKSTIMQKLQSAAAVITVIWNGIKWTFVDAGRVIKAGVSGAFNSVRSKVIGVMSAVLNAIRSKLSAARSIVSGILNAIRSKFQSVFNGVKSIVVNAINKVKSAFNFSWKLPDLKIPKVTVTGGTPPFGIAGKGSLPEFHVEWYRKAYDNAYLLRKPTIFGSSGGSLLGGGEGSGSELVIGFDRLTQALQTAMTSAVRTPDETKNITVNIPKLADEIIVREDADIDRIAAAMAHKMEIVFADSF